MVFEAKSVNPVIKPICHGNVLNIKLGMCKGSNIL